MRKTYRAPDLDLTMRRTIWLPVALLSAPPVLIWLWMLIPALQPVPQRISGGIGSSDVCFGYCRPVVSVASTPLSCRSDLIGFPYACAPRLLEAGTGSAVYFTLPTLSGLLRSSPTAGVLLELERDGQIVFRRSVRSQAFASIYGGWIFHAVYWLIVALILWRWPGSRIGSSAQGLSHRQ